MHKDPKKLREAMNQAITAIDGRLTFIDEDDHSIEEDPVQLAAVKLNKSCVEVATEIINTTRDLMAQAAGKLRSLDIEAFEKMTAGLMQHAGGMSDGTIWFAKYAAKETKNKTILQVAETTILKKSEEGKALMEKLLAEAVQVRFVVSVETLELPVLSTFMSCEPQTPDIRPA